MYEFFKFYKNSEKRKNQDRDGEGGIRTLVALRQSSFRDCRIQPLCHLSKRVWVYLPRFIIAEHSPSAD